MSIKKIIITLLVILFVGVLGFNIFKGGSTDSQANLNASSTNQGTEIVFFWLPSGAPCQQQDKILQALEKEKPELKVTRVDVNEPASSVLANKYGIRTVPSSVILNEKGATIKQFTPGVQTEATLKKYLK
jgi:thioredoxin-like negative regulator of GroEL